MALEKKLARKLYAFRLRMRDNQTAYGEHKYPLRNPDDEDDGGGGGDALKRHPLLDEEAQFSRSNEEATLPTDKENRERIEEEMRSGDELRHEFVKQYVKQLNQKLGKSFNPGFRPPGM